MAKLAALILLLATVALESGKLFAYSVPRLTVFQTQTIRHILGG